MMTIRRIGVSLASLALALGCTESLANGFRNPPESAKALALDGGKLTQINDAAAVAVNPANLTSLGQSEFSANLTMVKGDTDYSSPAGSASTESSVIALGNIFGAWPIEKQNMVFGLGVTTPYGQSTEWDENSIFRYTSPHLAELMVVNVNPTLAARVGDRASVAAGLDVYYSELEFKQFMPWSTVVGAPAPDGRMRFEGDGEGVGWNLAARFDLSAKQRVAATYRSSVKVDYDGSFSVSDVPAPGLAAPNSDFGSEIEYPSAAAIGYSVDVRPDITIGVDVEWIEFSTFDELPMDIGVNNALLPASAIPQQWDDTWTYGLGAAWRANENWSLYGGYKFMETPIPDQTMAPTLPDADRHLLTVGAGYREGAHRVDVAYAYSIFDDRDITQNLVPAFNGSYELSSQLLGLSYGYIF